MRKDGRTDTTELIVAVRNFASAEKHDTENCGSSKREELDRCGTYFYLIHIIGSRTGEGHWYLQELRLLKTSIQT
jgi:hypothetical protein